MKKNVGIKKSRRQKRKNNRRLLNGLLSNHLSKKGMSFDRLYADLVIQQNTNIDRWSCRYEWSYRSYILCRLVDCGLQLPCLDKKYVKLEESLRLKMNNRINNYERFGLSSIKDDLKNFYNIVVAYNIKNSRVGIILSREVSI